MAAKKKKKESVSLTNSSTTNHILVGPTSPTTPTKKPRKSTARSSNSKKPFTKKELLAAIPKKVKITYAEFDLIPISHERASDYEIAGKIYPNERKILFDKTLPPTELLNTLIHEILHGIVYFYGLKFTGDLEEETAVNSLANGLTTVLKDNLDFLKLLADGLERSEDSTESATK